MSITVSFAPIPSVADGMLTSGYHPSMTGRVSAAKSKGLSTETGKLLSLPDYLLVM